MDEGGKIQMLSEENTVRVPYPKHSKRHISDANDSS